MKGGSHSNAPHDTIKLTPVLPDVSGLKGDTSSANKKGLPSPLLALLPVVALCLGVAGLVFMFWKLSHPADAALRQAEARQTQILQDTYEKWIQMGGTHEDAPDHLLDELALNILRKLASPPNDKSGIGTGETAVHPETSSGIFSSASVRLELHGASLSQTEVGVLIDDHWFVQLERKPSGVYTWKALARHTPPVVEQKGLLIYRRWSP